MGAQNICLTASWFRNKRRAKFGRERCLAWRSVLRSPSQWPAMVVAACCVDSCSAVRYLFGLNSMAVWPNPNSCFAQIRHLMKNFILTNLSSRAKCFKMRNDISEYICASALLCRQIFFVVFADRKLCDEPEAARFFLSACKHQTVWQMPGEEGWAGV